MTYARAPEYRTLLAGAIRSPGDMNARVVFADWVQDHGDEEEAQRIRHALPIPVYSCATSLGRFTVSADWIAMLSPEDFPPMTYRLRIDEFPSLVASFPSSYEAVSAVGQHQSGLREWDVSTEQAPDYAPRWDTHVKPDHQERLLRVYLALKPEGSMDSLVQHFEFRLDAFLDRLKIERLFIEWIRSGEVTRLPNMDFAPAELKGLERELRKKKPRA